jgi:hypothetical protein
MYYIEMIRQKEYGNQIYSFSRIVGSTQQVHSG